MAGILARQAFRRGHERWPCAQGGARGDDRAAESIEHRLPSVKLYARFRALLAMAAVWRNTRIQYGYRGRCVWPTVARLASRAPGW